MATSKSELGSEQLQSALTSGDGTLVLEALRELESLAPSKGVIGLLNSTLKQINEPVLAFQINKTLRLLTTRYKQQPIPSTLSDLESLIGQPNRLDELAIIISILDPGDAFLASDLFRSAHWNEWPATILPTLCRHFKEYGSVADTEALIELSRHPDPTVLTTALEALETLDPNNLQSLVTPLLTNPNPGIRARAIQALYRWNKAVALQHLVSLLFSKNPTEPVLALHHAISFPYPEIEPHLIRFVSEVADPKLLMRVSQIMKTNAYPDLPFKLYWICRSLKDPHRNLVKGILIGVVRTMTDNKIISVEPQEFLDQLKNRVKTEEERRLRESLSLDLSSNEKETAAAAKEALAHLNQPESETHGVSSTTIPTVNLSPENFENLDSKQRIQLLGMFSNEQYYAFRGKLEKLIKVSKGKELAALIRVIGRFGSLEETRFIKRFIDNNDPDLVCGAIEALSNLDAEFLGIYLPQLMQSTNGKIRMRATRAFVGIDRKQMKSLLDGLLSSSQRKQRAMAINAAVLVDFALVRDSLIKALNTENSPDMVKKIGLVICANPDRELLREVFQISKRAQPDVKKAIEEIVQQLAINLSIALEKISSPEDLLTDEENSFLQKEKESEASASKKGAQPPLPPKPISPPPEVIKKAKRAKASTIIWVFVIIAWLAMIVAIFVNHFFG